MSPGECPFGGSQRPCSQTQTCLERPETSTTSPDCCRPCGDGRQRRRPSAVPPAAERSTCGQAPSSSSSKQAAALAAAGMRPSISRHGWEEPQPIERACCRRSSACCCRSSARRHAPLPDLSRPSTALCAQVISRHMDHRLYQYLLQASCWRLWAPAPGTLGHACRARSTCMLPPTCWHHAPLPLPPAAHARAAGAAGAAGRHRCAVCHGGAHADQPGAGGLHGLAGPGVDLGGVSQPMPACTHAHAAFALMPTLSRHACASQQTTAGECHRRLGDQQGLTSSLPALPAIPGRP